MMPGRAVSWNSTRGVDAAIAKQILDPLLVKFSKRQLANMSGLCAETLDHIDHLKVRRVDHSTVRALQKIVHLT